MRPFRLIPAGLAVLLVSCATTPAGYYPGGSVLHGVSDPHAEPGRPSRLVNCNVPPYHRLNADPASARPGEQVELRHTFEFSPYGPQHIPLTCVDRWQIDPPEAATLSNNRRMLSVSANAAPGSAISVTVTANGYAHRLVLPVLPEAERGW